MRIMNQHHISTADLKKAHSSLLQFVYEFELLYYQRRSERLHFVRQSIHALTHLGPEVVRVGPLIISSWWVMLQASLACTHVWCWAETVTKS